MNASVKILYTGKNNMTLLVTDMFKNTCRTCLNTNGEMVPIFSSGYYVKQLPKKLMAFAKVEISDNDQLPKTICKKCMFLADSFYCFKEQCESADNQLKLFIQRNLTRDNSSTNVDNKPDSNNVVCNRSAEVALITNFKKVISDDKSMNNEAKNILEITQETKDNYFVEYISDEVRINVENAFKRRQEAERMISMEKVSQSIKNLKGIEVVPVRNVKTDRSTRNSRTEKEEIVVFPVKVPDKRSRIIETIVIDDTQPLNKRLKLPPETTVSKIIGGDDVKREDSIVYGKHGKLNFSTVRKVVKIDDEELCVEPKQEFIKESERENHRFKYDTDVVVLSSNDNEVENRRSQYSKIQNNKRGSEIIYSKQESNVFKAKLQEEPKDDGKNIKTQLFKFSNGNIPNNNKDSSHCNENKKPQDINSVKNENKSNNYHSTIEKPVQFFRSLESKEIDSQKVEYNLQNHNGIAKSTIGCIISGIDEQDFDFTDVSTFENGNDSTKRFSDYRTDRSNQFFIENEVNDISNNCATGQKEVGKNFKLDSISFAGNQRGNSGDSSSFSDQVTPLALLSVNSSGEANRTINLKIYKRKDSERIKGTMKDDYCGKDRSLVSSAHQNTGNSNSKIYQCTVCSMNFVSMPDVLKHNIEEHMADQSPVFCLICDKSFGDKHLLCDHVGEHNGSEPYRCTFCPKQFTLKRNLKRHINHHINNRPFQCRICMKRFTEKFSLKSHMYLHNGNSPFSCKICNVSFNNKTNWRRHVVTIHEKLTVTVCKFCNKELPNKRSLRVHTRVHTGDRPYQCPHCDKRFTQQCNLNTHIHCHLNDRPFSCPHCSKGFNQRGTRDDHILTHTGEKPHKCMECDASFTVPSALKRHMWIHTDKDRPHNCDKCGLQFIGLYDLRRHLKIRHGEVSKLDNPRVERVLLDDETKEEIDGSDSSGESKFNEGVQSSRVSECSKTEITAKENSSLSCNVNKIEDLEKEEEVKECLLYTKIENLNNLAKKEMVNNFNDDNIMLSGEDIGSRNSCTDINEN